MESSPSAPNNVAPPPFSLTGPGALAALAGLEGVASAQALGFYRIPLFLLPIYKAAAVQYGIPWQFLAAINEIETDYGNDLSVSTAGALGWMQFMPATWLQYGVDALDAGYADPYNPVDAIFAAARYLRAAGASADLRGAILAYNHSQEYVESVLLRAKLISTYPKPVIATLTGLVDGRPPVTGSQVSWEALATSPAGSPSATAAGEGATGQSGSSVPAGGPSGVSGVSAPSTSPPPPSAAASGSSASHGSGTQPLKLVDVRSAPSASVVAVQDGRILQMGHSRQLGKYLVLRDVYGDVYTYAGLGSIAGSYTPPKPAGSTGHSSAVEAASTRAPAPSQPASAGIQSPVTLSVKHPPRAQPPQAPKTSVAPHPGIPAVPAGSLQALFAAINQPAAPAGSLQATLDSISALFHAVLQPSRQPARTSAAKPQPKGPGMPLRRGSVVESGTVLGRVSVPAGAQEGHLQFAIRPAGDSATIDPAPIMAGWVQLQAALHPQGAQASNPLLGATASDVFLLSKAALEGTVLADPGITIGACARRDVGGGSVDRRALAVLAFLSRSGLHPSVGALPCAPAASSRQGAAPQDSVRAVAITGIDGTPIAGHQGTSSITDLAIRTLLTLPSEFVPSEITSLMHYPGSANTQANAVDWNRIRLGFSPAPAPAAASPAATPPTPPGEAAGTASSGGSPASPLLAANPLNAAQWNQLIKRVSELPTPTVATKPSSSAVADPKHP